MKLEQILLGATSLVAAILAGAPQSAQAAAANPPAQCQLNSVGGKIKRVVYIVFDNVHFTRDNPNVPSDLEQMPNLLNFITQKGTLSYNHHTPLISHTANDILTTLTGVYGDRHGSPISNAFGIFTKDNSTVKFQSSFVYWTSNTQDSNPATGENLPILIDETGKNAPAPWVPYTRAGCDVGSFSLNGLGIENKFDIAHIFDAATAAGAAYRDYYGIAIHCAQGSPLCNNSYARPDVLPDEPGGYDGFSALYGNINVKPVISPDAPVADLDGNTITDPYSGKEGFPTDFNPSATQSLGYAATLLEAGVPVVYTYIADAHDPHPGVGSRPTYGPGEAAYVAALKAYDTAFGKFFSRLKADGIDESNTLFVVVPDENDHFAGADPSPAGCDGVHTPCTYGKLGEVTVAFPSLLLAQRGNTTTFDLHFDTAPNFYIYGNPGQTDSVTRKLEQDSAAITVTNPISGKTEQVSDYIADQAEMKLLHMVTASPQRTPNFTMFAKPDYYVTTLNYATYTDKCVTTPPSGPVFEDSCYAYLHGSVQPDISTTWMGMVGPGVRNLGKENTIWSDHADVRPTALALLGLRDDYLSDGRVVVERLNLDALPKALRGERGDSYRRLASVYKQLNAPVGRVGLASLAYANKAAINVSAADYALYLKNIGRFTDRRDALVAKIKTALFNAAFDGKPIDRDQIEGLGERARSLIENMERRARSGDQGQALELDDSSEGRFGSK